MLELKSTVFYGTTGVCVVERMETKKIGRESKDYYVLKPVAQCSSTVYVPTDNEVLLSKVREVISKSEVLSLLNESEVQDLWIDNESERRNAFANLVSTGSCRDRLNLMKTMHKKQRELSENSKRLHLSDERYFKDVSRLVCDEFSFVLELTVKEVEELIYK